MNKPGDDILIRCQGLSKTYPNTRTNALRQVQLDIRRAEFISITGPSGSGKSTFLNILAALIEPTEGEVSFRGRPYSEIKNKPLFRRENIGYIFQDFYLYPGFSALENILIASAYSLLRPRSLKDRALELLSYLNLGSKALLKVNTLSAGERQRVCIARALIHQPALILADEPTGSLDSNNARAIMDILKVINAEKEATIIMATHDMRMAGYAHRNIAIEDGVLRRS